MKRKAEIEMGGDEEEQTPGEARDELPGIVCPRCATPNDPANTLCSRCGAPLGDFASSAPWDYSHARGPAYPEPVSPRKKPVILVGVWLYFGPSAVAAAIVLVDLAKDFLFPGRPLSGDGSGVLALMALLAAYFIACLWVLYTVTRRFLKKE